MCVCTCKGATSFKGNKGDKGDSGTNGTNGIQGIYGGFSGEFVFNTSTSTGPGSTLLRFNNTTYSSVFRIYVSDTGVGSVNYDAFLDSFLNNSNYGYVRVYKKDDSTKFWMGIITAVTDNGTDHTLDVTYITSNGTFAAADPLVLTFSPTGPGLKWDTISFNNNVSAPYVAITGIVSNQVISTFIYPGTNNVGAISKIMANIWTANAANNPGINIYDVTNSLLIAGTSAGTSGLTAQIIDLGTIFNLPANPAVFQIRMSASAAYESRLGSIMIGSF